MKTTYSPITRIPHHVRMVLAKMRFKKETKHGCMVMYIQHRTPTWLRVHRLIGRHKNDKHLWWMLREKE